MTFVQLDSAFDLLRAAPATAVAAAVIDHRGVAGLFTQGHTDGQATEPLTHDHFFDLASLTKVLAVLPEVLDLLERGALSLQDPLSQHLPDAGWMLDERSVGTATIAQLLTHTAGLPNWLPLHLQPADRVTLLARVLQTPLEALPGTRTLYSCAGFITLGVLVERLTGRSLAQLATARGWVTYTPDGPAVATELCPWRGRLLRGEVHDELAGALGGVSGNAGAFGRLSDVCRAAQAWLTDAVSPATADLMTRPWTHDANGIPRGLGWELGHHQGFAGSLSGPRGFGHTGFTGTSLWVEPERGYAIVLLTNRVHPSRHAPAAQRIFELRLRFHNAVHAAWRPDGNGAATRSEGRAARRGLPD